LEENVSYSLVLLTAGWMAGQSPYASTTVYTPVNPGSQPCAQAPMPVQTMSCSDASPGPLGLGLWSRFKSAFRRGCPGEEYTVPPYGTTMPDGRLQPVAQMSPPGCAPVPESPPVTTVLHQEDVAGQPSAEEQEAGATSEPPLPQNAAGKGGSPIRKRFQDQVGSAEDYSWITGQLTQVHTSDGELWVLRYAPLDREDRYGGSVVLAPVVEMKNYREGDLVCVQGEVLKEKNAPGRLGGALYRVNVINMMTRTDPWELRSSHDKD
jgi:hypothetical protein